MKFIHISDLHIHYGENENDTISARLLVNEIISKYTSSNKPWVVITGDLVQDGRKRQYKKAVEILSELIENGFKLLIQPGNHDYGPRGFIAYTELAQGRFQKYILGRLLDDKRALQSGVEMEDLYPRLIEHDDDGVVFIELDSVEEVEDAPAHFARGAIGSFQMRKMVTEIDKAMSSGKKVVVLVHHHPFYRGELAAPVMEMEDSREFMTAIKGKVDVLCFGHKHKSDCWSFVSNQDRDGYSEKYQVPWILASGKSNDRTKDGKLFFREVEISRTGISMSEVKVG